jgi:hypothetical protein
VPPPISFPAPRAFSRSVVLWVFGVCTTLLLAGLWGRAVTTDETTLDESAQAVLNSQIVNDRLEDWILGTVQTLGDLPPAEAQSVVQGVVGSPEMDHAVGILVDSTVAAALAPPDEPTDLDLQPAMEALEPAIDRALDAAGMPVDAALITATLGDLSVSSGEVTMASSTVVGARAALTRVVVVASLGLMIAGAVAVSLAENRVEQLRSLFWRLAVSGFTFSVFLRLGAWAVDPSGGRSPVAAGGSVILRSNLDIPLGIAFVAVTAATGFMLMRNRRRAVVEVDDPVGREGDSTGEHRILVDA